MLFTKNKFKSLLKQNMQKNNSIKTFKKCKYANREKQIWKRELGEWEVTNFRIACKLNSVILKKQDYGIWKYKG